MGFGRAAYQNAGEDPAGSRGNILEGNGLAAELGERPGVGKRLHAWSRDRHR